jgi:hypothetical protein
MDPLSRLSCWFFPVRALERRHPRLGSRRGTQAGLCRCRVDWVRCPASEPPVMDPPALRRRHERVCNPDALRDRRYAGDGEKQAMGCCAAPAVDLPIRDYATGSICPALPPLRAPCSSLPAACPFILSQPPLLCILTSLYALTSRWPDPTRLSLLSIDALYPLPQPIIITNARAHA